MAAIRATFLAAIAAAALLPACAQAQRASGPVPRHADLRSALRPVPHCGNEPEGLVDCGNPPLEIEILAARCLAQPPFDGAPVAVCQVSWRLTWVGAGKSETFTGQCVRLHLFRFTPEERPEWALDRTLAPPCPAEPER